MAKQMGSPRTAKIYCRVSRKISDGNFGSHEVCGGIELDVEFDNPRDLLGRHAEIRRLLVRAVERGLREQMQNADLP